VLCVLWSLGAAHGKWEDCADEQGDEQGPYGLAPHMNVTSNGTLFYVLHPAETSAAPFPVVIFMHGLTGQYEMYQRQMEFYASHGFIVFFPFIISPDADKRTFPPVTNTDGKFMKKGLLLAGEMNADPASPLHAMLDMQNVALNGHSMGATCTIMAAATLPAGSVKVAVAQHPGVCGPFGPPPWPSTWFPTDMEKANSMMPMLMTTATNDAAFWPSPMTAEHELGCFKEVTPGHLGLAYAEFSNASCVEDGQRKADGFPDGGHNCPLKIPSPETPWAFAAIKLYTQLGGDASSKCYAKVWGDGEGSMQKSKTLQQAVVHAPSAKSTAILV